MPTILDLTATFLFYLFIFALAKTQGDRKVTPLIEINSQDVFQHHAGTRPISSDLPLKPTRARSRRRQSSDVQ